jgi:hypothetical protein
MRLMAGAIFVAHGSLGEKSSAWRWHYDLMLIITNLALAATKGRGLGADEISTGAKLRDAFERLFPNPPPGSSFLPPRFYFHTPIFSTRSRSLAFRRMSSTAS